MSYWHFLIKLQLLLFSENWEVPFDFSCVRRTALPSAETEWSPFSLKDKSWSVHGGWTQRPPWKDFLTPVLSMPEIRYNSLLWELDTCQDDSERKTHSLILQGCIFRVRWYERGSHSIRIVDLSWPKSISWRNKNSGQF